MSVLRKQIFLPAAMLLMLAPPAAGRSRESEGVEYLRAEISLSSNTVYVGEPFIYRIILTTDNKNIRNIRLLEANENSAFTLLSSLDSERKISRASDGLYNITAVSDILLPTESGTMTIPGGTYGVDYVVPTTVYDPFWGYIQTGERLTKQVTVKNSRIKVKSLPSAPNGFSGAVGEYTFDCDTPEVRVTPGGEVSLIYTLSGHGWLKDIEVPDFKGAFGSDVKMKSITPHESAFIQRGQLISKITYEVRITASNTGTYEIPSIDFIYFSPEKGKYQTTASRACTVVVADSRNSSSSAGQYVMLDWKTEDPESTKLN